jgi:hypothetical protein
VIPKLGKAGTELTFSAPIGMELNQQWLNSLFNIFLIAPKRFIDLTSKEQAVALGIVTKQWDDKISVLKEEYSVLNKEIKKLELLEVVEPVEKAPLESLQARKMEIKEQLAEQYLQNQNANKATRKAWDEAKQVIDEETRVFNTKQANLVIKFNECQNAFMILKNHGHTSADVQEFLAGLTNEIKPQKRAADSYPEEPQWIPELPDQTALDAIDEKIVAASEINAKAQLYEDYLKKLEEKASKELARLENTRKQEELYSARLEYIKAFNFPLDSLSVDDEGGLLLKEKPLKPQYFSTGELLRIVPTLICSQNPELKYIFIQEANLLDLETLEKIEEDLTSKGFQLVFEMVGKEKIIDKNCILLRNSKEVQEYPTGIKKIERISETIEEIPEEPISET